MTAPTTARPTTTIETDRPGAERRPGALRRAAVGLTGALALFIPTVWTLNISRMALTGVESEHLFHQLTGQGLLMLALWLTALVRLVRAGWRGRRPSVAAGLQHLAFAAAAAGCAVAAPGGGAPSVVVIITVTGALLWLALPARPRLRRVAGQLDPVLAPVALIAAAVHVPYAIEQIGLQNGAVGYHAQNPHFFDMAWLSITLVLLAAIASAVPAARRLVIWTTAGSLIIGAAGLATAEATGWPLLMIGVGAVGGAAALLRLRAGQDG